MTPPVSYKAEPCKGYLDTKPIECSNQAFSIKKNKIKRKYPKTLKNRTYWVVGDAGS